MFAPIKPPDPTIRYFTQSVPFNKSALLLFPDSPLTLKMAPEPTRKDASNQEPSARSGRFGRAKAVLAASIAIERCNRWRQGIIVSGSLSTHADSGRERSAEETSSERSCHAYDSPGAMAAGHRSALRPGHRLYHRAYLPAGAGGVVLPTDR